MIKINCSCGNQFIWHINCPRCKCGNEIPKEFFPLLANIEYSLQEVSLLSTKRSNEHLCNPFTIIAK